MRCLRNIAFQVLVWAGWAAFTLSILWYLGYLASRGVVW